jgi:hypothetical protein
MRKRPSPLVPRDPPQGRVKFVCDSAVGEGEGGSFYPPSGRVAEEERRSGEGYIIFCLPAVVHLLSPPRRTVLPLLIGTRTYDCAILRPRTTRRLTTKSVN